jgi:hypothetical protein
VSEVTIVSISEASRLGAELTIQQGYENSALRIAARYLFGGLKPNKPPVLPGEINTLVYERITSDDRMVKVWRPHYQASKEVINMEKKHSQSQRTFHMEMPVSCRICT